MEIVSNNMIKPDFDNIPIGQYSDLHITNNIKSVGQSLLTFEVSENETCDSNLSDDFQTFTESPVLQEMYYEDDTVDPSSCSLSAHLKVFDEPGYVYDNRTLNLSIESDSSRTTHLINPMELQPDHHVHSSSFTDLSLANQQNIITMTKRNEIYQLNDDLLGYDYFTLPSSQNDYTGDIIQGCFPQLEINSDFLSTSGDSQYFVNTLATGTGSQAQSTITDGLNDFKKLDMRFTVSNTSVVNNNHVTESYNNCFNYYTQPYVMDHVSKDYTQPLSDLSIIVTSHNIYDNYLVEQPIYTNNNLQEVNTMNWVPPFINVPYDSAETTNYTNATLLVSNSCDFVNVSLNEPIPNYWIQDSFQNNSELNNITYSQIIPNASASDTYEINTANNFDYHPVASFIVDETHQPSTSIPSLYIQPHTYSENNSESRLIYAQHLGELDTQETTNCLVVPVCTLASNESKFVRSQKWNCTHCSRTFSRPSHLVDHLRIHTGERPFACVLCGHKFTQASNLRRHLFSHKAWSPNLIPYSKVSLGDETINYVSQDNNCMYKPKSLSSNLLRKVWNCRFCDQRFEKYLQLRAHMVHHKDRQVYICTLNDCRQTFVNPNSLLKHILDEHKSQDMHGSTCHICHQSFAKFVRHSLPRRSGAQSGCPLFHRPNRRKFSNLKHSKKSVGEFNFPSTIINSSSVSETRIKLVSLDKVTHSSSFGYKCPFCDKICPTIRNIRVHLCRNHSNVILEAAGETRIPNQTIADSKTATVSNANQSGLFLLQLEKCPKPDGQAMETVCQSMKSNSTTKQSPINTTKSFVCHLCGKVFKKAQFFYDHRIMCEQAIAERQRRLRLRANKLAKFSFPYQSNSSFGNDSCANTLMIAKTTTAISTNTVSIAGTQSQITVNDDENGPRRSSRTKSFQVYWKPKQTRMKRT